MSDDNGAKKNDTQRLPYEAPRVQLRRSLERAILFSGGSGTTGTSTSGTAASGTVLTGGND